jgi:dihydrofolate reductase
MANISIIVAMDEQAIIGCAAGLPWHLPLDLKRFRSLTMGKPIVMGRRTHQQIGRVLPGRTNIVLTHDARLQAPGCVMVHSVEEALAEACECVTTADDEIMVIGGAQVYRLFLPLCRRMYVTAVAGKFEGNAWFPEGMPAPPTWALVHQEAIAADRGNPHAHRYLIFERAEASPP